MTKLKTIIGFLIGSALFIGCQQNPEKKEEHNVNFGVITYSFRSMPDQSPEAIIEYVKQTGLTQVELMGNHAEPFAGAPVNPIWGHPNRGLLYKLYRNEELTDDEREEAALLQQEIAAYNEEVAQWRKDADYGKFEELKNMYAEAGISIYAFKPSVFGTDNTDEDIRYGMRAAKALGATHITLEHPENDEHTARLGRLAEEEGVFVGYHGHTQQTPTFWDDSMAISDAIRMNLDIGHYVAAGNPEPLKIVEEKHDKIVSMHLKDRKNKENGQDNMMWGEGDTPIKALLQLMKDRGYDFPLTIELEYEIPEGSDAVQEVKRSYDYAKSMLN